MDTVLQECFNSLLSWSRSLRLLLAAETALTECVAKSVADGAVPDRNMCAESATAGEGAAWAYALLAVAHGGLVLPAVLAPCQVCSVYGCNISVQGSKGGLCWERHRRVKVHASDTDQRTIFLNMAAQALLACISLHLLFPAMAIKLF